MIEKHLLDSTIYEIYHKFGINEKRKTVKLLGKWSTTKLQSFYTCKKNMQAPIIEKLSFEQLPAAISELLARVKTIEALLANGNVTADIQGEMMDIEETSAFLKLSVSTIYSKVCRGEIPAIKPGRRLYFNKAEMIEWLKLSRKKSTQELISEFQVNRGRIPFQRKRRAGRTR